MTLYMYIDTSDEFLLPLAVADSAAQLGEMIGKNRVNILSNIYHAHERGAVSPYEKIELPEEDVDDELLGIQGRNRKDYEASERRKRAYRKA